MEEAAQAIIEVAQVRGWRGRGAERQLEKPESPSLPPSQAEAAVARRELDVERQRIAQERADMRAAFDAHCRAAERSLRTRVSDAISEARRLHQQRLFAAAATAAAEGPSASARSSGGGSSATDSGGDGAAEDDFAEFAAAEAASVAPPSEEPRAPPPPALVPPPPPPRHPAAGQKAPLPLMHAALAAKRPLAAPATGAAGPERRASAPPASLVARTVADVHAFVQSVWSHGGAAADAEGAVAGLEPDDGDGLAHPAPLPDSAHAPPSPPPPSADAGHPLLPGSGTISSSAAAAKQASSIPGQQHTSPAPPLPAQPPPPPPPPHAPPASRTPSRAVVPLTPLGDDADPLASVLQALSEEQRVLFAGIYDEARAAHVAAELPGSGGVSHH